MIRSAVSAAILGAFAATFADPLAAQGCATGSDTWWQRDTLPQVPSGLTSVSVIQGLSEGESAGVVFEMPANMGAQLVTQVAAPWGAPGGIAGFNALLDLEVYDGVSFNGGIVNMGTRVFSLSQDLNANMQVSSHGLNVLDTSTYNIVVGNAPPNGTPFVRRFAICFRVDLNLHPSGSCATGWPANFFTDASQASIFCNPVVTPNQTSIIEYYNTCGGAYMGWRDVTAATVSGIPICGIYYQGIWAIRCCTRDAFPATYTIFGAGCSGTLGMSQLQNLSLPQIGQTLDVRITNLPQNLAIMATGWSNVSSPLGPLPFDMTPFGAPGCLARVSPDVSQFLIGTNNRAFWSLTLPNDPGLIGANLHQQALSLDAGFNNLGATLSEAATIGIGN